MDFAPRECIYNLKCLQLPASLVHIYGSGIPARLKRVTATCRSFRCFNCEKPGHHCEDCPEAKLCSVCKSPSHAFRHCPYVIHAVNFVAQPTRSLYADLASTAEVTLRILRIGVPSVCSMLIIKLCLSF